MFFLRHINHIKSYVFFTKLNEDNTYTKIIHRDLQLPRKIITYLGLMVFLTFHTRGLTPLELNLTEVARREKEFRIVAPMRTQLFNGLLVIINFYNGT